MRVHRWTSKWRKLPLAWMQNEMSSNSSSDGGKKKAWCSWSLNICLDRILFSTDTSTTAHVGPIVFIICVRFFALMKKKRKINKWFGTWRRKKRLRWDTTFVSSRQKLLQITQDLISYNEIGTFCSVTMILLFDFRNEFPKVVPFEFYCFGIVLCFIYIFRLE